MDEKDYKQDIKINRFALEIDCEEHPSNYLYWSEKLAEAKSTTDSVKDKVDLLRGEKELHYRIHPRGVQKVTESSIKSMIDTDKEMIDLRQELLRAKRDQNILQAAVSSLEHKKAELDNLRHLWIAGYYSDPSRSRSSTDDKEDAARSALNKRDD